MSVNELTEDVLRALSEVEAAEPVVVSMFVDLDATELATPAARETQFNSLLSALDEQIRQDGLSDDAKDSLAADRARIEAFLREEFDPSDATAIAIYSALALDFFRAVKVADASNHVSNSILIRC